MKIQPIVEGFGEVEALPVVLRRLVQQAQAWDVGVGRPIRRPRNSLVKEGGVRQAVRLAVRQPECGAVLVLVDGESDCPADLGTTAQKWAAAAAADRPCCVVLAHREYEAWFSPPSNRCADSAASGRMRCLIRLWRARANPEFFGEQDGHEAEFDLEQLCLPRFICVNSLVYAGEHLPASPASVSDMKESLWLAGQGEKSPSWG